MLFLFPSCGESFSFGVWGSDFLVEKMRKAEVASVVWSVGVL